jgi:hypothetical protein
MQVTGHEPVLRHMRFVQPFGPLHLPHQQLRRVPVAVQQRLCRLNPFPIPPHTAARHEAESHSENAKPSKFRYTHFRYDFQKTVQNYKKILTYAS